MFNIFLFPLNIVISLSICFFLSLLSYSWIYPEVTTNDALNLLIMIFLYLMIYIFMYKSKRPTIHNDCGLSGVYKKFMSLSLIGFVCEFYLYGVPILMKGGRDEYAGIPVLHVIFYSSAIIAVLLSSLYSSKKALTLSILVALCISVLTLSRQMMMVVFAITLISAMVRYKITAKVLFYTVLAFAALGSTFGLIGNIRQQISGDYIDDYILVIGGANSGGQEIGSSLYWLWLYMATPIYNLMLNLNHFDVVGSGCVQAYFSGSCDGSFVSSVLLPNTIAKYAGQSEFKIDLVIPFLNAGTGYSTAARILGLWGVVLQILIQVFYYLVGYLLTPKKLRVAFIVYFSALSMFMIFDSLYTRGEFFFGFILICFAWLMRGKDVANEKSPIGAGN